MDDPFGGAGGARGIDDVEGIAGLGREIGGRGSCGRHPVGQFLVEQDPLHAGEAVLAQLGQSGAVDEDMPCAAIGGHASELLRTGAGGQRRRHPARAHRGEKDQRIGNRGIAEDRDRLPALEACFDQFGRDPVELGVHFAPTQLAAIVAQRQRFGLHCGPAAQDGVVSAEGGGEIGG